jgi:hypothetical protein
MSSVVEDNLEEGEDKQKKEDQNQDKDLLQLE